ncbi:MAG: DUF721 domain-containing protein [Pirellulales bacterium]
MARRRKALPDEADLRDLQFQYQQRRWARPDPAKINNLVADLMARRGYGQLLSASELQDAWQEIVGAAAAAKSRVGKVTRGVLQVFVQSSVLVQELTFKKQKIVADLSRRLPDRKIRDVKFRVDAS